jgi:hypothetical protein
MFRCCDAAEYESPRVVGESADRRLLLGEAVQHRAAPRIRDGVEDV